MCEIIYTNKACGKFKSPIGLKIKSHNFYGTVLKSVLKLISQGMDEYNISSLSRKKNYNTLLLF